MDTIIWSRVSSDSQDNLRQILNLKQVATDKGWTVKRVFQETVSGTVSTADRKEFAKLLDYAETQNIKLVLVSEISRIGRRVVDILNTVDLLHKRGISLYVQQFSMLSLQDGKENPMVMMLLQMLSIGSELENSQRRIRQKQGIALARLQHPEKFAGRKAGSRGDRDKQLKKYADVVDLLKKSDLSLRRIASITERSINTVIKVRNLLSA